VKKKDFDIVIVGGGMVGAALACALGDSSLKVAVLEAKEPDYNWKTEHDIRVSAITHASQRIFQNLNVWQQMLDEGACSYHEMSVWDMTGDGQIHFDSAEVGAEDLGHIIENRIIQKALQQRLIDFDNIEFLYPFQSQQLHFDSDGVQIIDSNNNIIHANLIVGADGANSWVRKQANIELNSWDYEQTAVVAVVKTSESHRNTCWQQFMPTGPLAFLPLQQNYSAIVWSTSPQHAEFLTSLSEQKFNEELQLTFGSVLGRISIVSDKAGFPLRLRHAKQYIQNNLALIGDAAHTVHPLAGQGVNLGLLDAAALAEVLLEANNKHKNMGSFSVLRKYERQRKGGNVSMLAAMDMFKRLFSNDNLFLKGVRNFGLKMAGNSSTARSFFIKQALGDNQELPKLAKYLS